MAETVEIVFGSDDLARGVEDGLRCDERRELGLAARGFRERFRRWEAIGRIRRKYGEHNLDRHARAVIRAAVEQLLLSHGPLSADLPHLPGTGVLHSGAGIVGFALSATPAYRAAKARGEAPEYACFVWDPEGFAPGTVPKLRFLTARGYSGFALEARETSPASRGGLAFEVARCSRRPGAHRAPVVWEQAGYWERGPAPAPLVWGPPLASTGPEGPAPEDEGGFVVVADLGLAAELLRRARWRRAEALARIDLTWRDHNLDRHARAVLRDAVKRVLARHGPIRAHFPHLSGSARKCADEGAIVGIGDGDGRAPTHDVPQTGVGEWGAFGGGPISALCGEGGIAGYALSDSDEVEAAEARGLELRYACFVWDPEDYNFAPALRFVTARHCAIFREIGEEARRVYPTATFEATRCSRRPGAHRAPIVWEPVA